MGWLQDHRWVVGVIVAAALVPAGLVWWARRRPATVPVPGALAQRRVDLTFFAAVLVTLMAGLAAVVWLLGQADQMPPGKDKAMLRADAVKTGVTIALGTGGAAYLLLAYRRQRLDEVDTRERRITELYTKAVEQLGHDQAPVRLGALYSLERLAQNNPEHRQPIVDVFCAYLRMPYTPPDHQPPGPHQAAPRYHWLRLRRHIRPAPPPDEPVRQELQVRQSAQRLLAEHLQLPTGSVQPLRPLARMWDRILAKDLQLSKGTPSTKATNAQRRRPSPRRAFWPGISLDLTGATLIDLNLERASIVQARLDRAIFYGDAKFEATTFTGKASFVGARFTGKADFNSATFDWAWFSGATFSEVTSFVGATFTVAVFSQATLDFVSFYFAKVIGDAIFAEVTFTGEAEFNHVSFTRRAFFRKASFIGTARFEKATFTLDAMFKEATFMTDALFGRATFMNDALFDTATFNGITRFDQALVLHLDDPDLNKRRVWPDGWTVRPDPADPTRGMLVPAEQVKKPKPAVPPSDRPADSD